MPSVSARALQSAGLCGAVLACVFSHTAAADPDVPRADPKTPPPAALLPAPEQLAADDFYVLEADFENYTQIHINETAAAAQRKKIEVKRAAFIALASKYRKLAHQRDPETAQAAWFRIGAMADQFVTVLAETLPPADVTAGGDEGRKLFTDAMEKAAQPWRAEADSAFAEAVAHSRRTGVTSYWSGRAYERLSLYHPGKYPLVVNPYFPPQFDPAADERIRGLQAALVYGRLEEARMRLNALPPDVQQTAAFYSTACALYTGWYQRLRAAGYCLKALDIDHDYLPAARNLMRLAFYLYDQTLMVRAMLALQKAKAPESEADTATACVMLFDGRGNRARDLLRGVMTRSPGNYMALYALTLVPQAAGAEQMAASRLILDRMGEEQTRLNFGELHATRVVHLAEAFDERVREQARAGVAGARLDAPRESPASGPGQSRE